MQSIIQEWATKETDMSFLCAEFLQSQLHNNFGGSSSVHVGFLYVAIGNNMGSNTTRYIIVIPFYDPTTHGYNYKVQNPFVYVRGFAGVSSEEYFAHLQEKWFESADLLPDGEGKVALLSCSPVHLYKFVQSIPTKLEYNRSNDSSDDSLSVFDGFLEFWIHGPRNTSAVKSLPVPFPTEDFQKFVKAVVDKEIKAKENLVQFIEPYRTFCNSFSFPTFQLEIKNPMEGYLPFPAKNLRLMVDEHGGTVHPSNSDVNAVHIKASTLEPPRKIALSNLWSQMINTLPGAMSEEVRKKKVFQSIKNLFQP